MKQPVGMIPLIYSTMVHVAVLLDLVIQEPSRIKGAGGET